MVGTMNNKTVSILMRGQIPVEAEDPGNLQQGEDPNAERRRKQEQQQMNENRGEDAMAEAEDSQRRASAGASRPRPTQPVHVGPKVGRNDPCPCGSGKKYKNCHGRGLV